MSAFVIQHDCKRPSVANMDHVKGCTVEPRPIVNRMCLTCGTHWYGDAETAVFAMPGKVWDGWVSTAFSAESA